MSIFKTRIWLVAYNTEIGTDDIDVLRKYKYHSIFKYMDKTDYKNFLKNIEYQIDKKTFQKLITNPRQFNSGTRWTSKNNRITPFSIEDHLTYVNLDMINDEAMVEALKSGKILDWFFDDIIQTTKQLDYAIKDVKKENKTLIINVKNSRLKFVL